MINVVDNYPIPTIESLKEDISALKELLDKTEALGITGSLAYGCFKKWSSDIDFFIILRECVNDKERDEMRSALQKLAWERCGRGADVLFYTLRGLKAIPSWYTVIMASGGVLLHDKGRVKKIFQRIVSLAQKSGTEVKIGAMICYDREFPESACILMLKGARLNFTLDV